MTLREQVAKFGGVARASEVFAPDVPLWVARAPGRLDVMGGIADYSGSRALQLPLAEATWCALQVGVRDDLDATIVVVSRRAQGIVRFSMPLNSLMMKSYDEARALFSSSQRWAAYVTGALLVLNRERGVIFKRELRFYFESNVPEGEGVSSSAALEVATMSALCGALSLEVAPRELALLCQKVENRIAGAPCGAMDQLAATCGQSGQLLALLCQPAEVLGGVAVPRGVALWGVASGHKHNLAATEGEETYTSVRAAAFMGRKILFEAAPEQSRASWNGYLCRVSPDWFEFFDRRATIPQFMSGETFLSRYESNDDAIAPVSPDRTYRVRAATLHAINEMTRVTLFQSWLERFAKTPSDEIFARMGEFMFASHDSYSACGLGSSATDWLVNAVRERQRDGLLGAKITGGGSGGTVAILGRDSPQAHDAVQQIMADYQRATGHAARVFTGSSDGAATFGVHQVG